MKTMICPRMEISFFLFAMLLNFSIVYPQEQHPPKDSLVRKAPSLNAGDLLPTPSILLHWSSRMDQESIRGFLFQPSPITGAESLPGFLRLSLAQPMQSYSWDSQQRLSLASCWREDVLRQQEYDSFKMILGTLETGGAAYLAYKHLRKYGLK